MSQLYKDQQNKSHINKRIIENYIFSNLILDFAFHDKCVSYDVLNIIHKISLVPDMLGIIYNILIKAEKNIDNDFTGLEYYYI